MIIKWSLIANLSKCVSSISEELESSCVPLKSRKDVGQHGTLNIRQRRLFSRNKDGRTVTMTMYTPPRNDVLKHCVCLVVFTNKMEGAFPSLKQIVFIYQFASYFGLDRPSSGDSCGHNKENIL